MNTHEGKESQDSGMNMMDQNCENCSEDSGMMMSSSDSKNFVEKSEPKEISKYRKIELVFKQKSENKRPKRRHEEDREIVKTILPQVIDFGTRSIPDAYAPNVEKVSSESFDNIYTLKSHPGFYFIVNPFDPAEQLHWIRQCLEVYPQDPNITNLNIHFGSVPYIWKNAQTGDPVKVGYLNKLAWATLGYQYAWTERKYEKEKFVKFPQDIGSVCTKIANQCGWESYIPEAAIINYYDVSQCMGGHLDNAEYEMEKPIISISFGNSAIFLLGGEDRNSEPIPILIRSGDVVVMGGRSRYCFHGVPRIIEGTSPHYLDPESVPKEFKPHCEYLKTKRININVRQVYKQ